MGYIVNFKYHPRDKESKFGFDMDSSKEKKIKLGKRDDPVSREELAISILKQLSRRDVLVYDVDVYEFVKKKISVKETNNGILIGNKKYTFDNDSELKEIPINNNIPTSNNQVSSFTKSPPINSQHNAIKKEFFVPTALESKNNMEQYKKIGLTPGKRYDIISEDSARFAYKVVNDHGGIATIGMRHFSAAPPVPDTPQASVNLSYPGGEVPDKMPSIR